MQKTATAPVPPTSYTFDGYVFSNAAETIVLDQIQTMGFTKISVTIFNYTNSANSISATALYGSPDGIHWSSALASSSVTVAAGTVGHFELTASWKYLRLTTTGAATIDALLIATP